MSNSNYYISTGGKLCITIKNPLEHEPPVVFEVVGARGYPINCFAQTNIMSDNKHYTPSIEEFHVGFEYQIWNDSIEGDKDGERLVPGTTWINRTIGNGVWDLKGQVKRLLDKEKIRVKYLDREDIENLGFDFSPNYEPIPNREKNPVFEGYLLDRQNETGEAWHLYQFKDGEVWIDYIKDCGGMGYIFKGTIKNKSQLKQILQWTGILK